MERSLRAKFEDLEITDMSIDVDYGGTRCALCELLRAPVPASSCEAT